MRNDISRYFIFISFLISSFVQSTEPDWSQTVEISTPRENIYEIDDNNFSSTVLAGRRHALFYPVSVSYLRIPYAPLKHFFEASPEDPIRKIIFDLTRTVSPFKSMQEVFNWLGLHEFPNEIQEENPNTLPELTGKEKSLPMGATIIKDEFGEALTFGCATCHSSDLFGVKILGLSNRFPRANEFFKKGTQLAPYVNTFIFKKVFQTTEGERLILARAKENLKYVGVKSPTSIGLDTSLAQVALSLARREADELATRSKNSYKHPRPNKLKTFVADSKPAVWWNLKYKNRWLSDGSIISGNPVHTNLLWNEIGRGTDLNVLEKWLTENNETIKELTAAVFASKAPRYEDFFGINSIDIEMAKRGQNHFKRSCQKCHGTYQKGWEQDNAHLLSTTQLIQNIKVIYHKKTPVINVATDPGRYLGMKEFSDDLNRLKISKKIKTIVAPQKGYVPPPLEGIWSRWPYFHNNSIPNLCALLTKSNHRPKTYWAGAAKDKTSDFDQECVGYPLGDKTPEHWKNDKDYLYDTGRQGLSARGHDEKIFIKNGVEIYTPDEKRELIEFLKTL